MAKIFVSYRRQDSPYVAQALKDRLERQFGENAVFLDIDNIPIGVDFRKHIDHAVQQCDVMLVLIGDAWLTAGKGKERNRLFEPRDFVRAEIEAAFRRAIPIVPVLVEDAEMPGTEDLPESIQDLTYRNSAELRAGRDFNGQVTRLVEGLGRMFQATSGSGVAASRTASPAEKLQPQSKRATRIGEAIAATFGALQGTNLFIEPSIPDLPLNNALRSYAPQVNAHDVLLLYEKYTPTRDGAGKETVPAQGLLLTETAIYWRTFGPAWTANFKNIKFEVSAASLTSLNGELIIVPDAHAIALEKFLKMLAAQGLGR